MKIYAVSTMAFRFRVHMEPDGSVREGSQAFTRPALIPAENMQAAVDACRAAAFEAWPKSDGWYGHHADILPVTNWFLQTGFEAYRAGVIKSDNEEPQSFDFDSGGGPE